MLEFLNIFEIYSGHELKSNTNLRFKQFKTNDRVQTTTLNKSISNIFISKTLVLVITLFCVLEQAQSVNQIGIFEFNFSILNLLYTRINPTRLQVFGLDQECLVFKAHLHVYLFSLNFTAKNNLN